MQTRQHIEKLIRVSQMYYDEGLNQSQIAGEVGYSRSSVSRMLTEARETGIVQITIGHPLQRLQSLEENLRNKYGLKTVRVAYSYDDSIASTLVPQCAAQLLVENLKPDSLIVTSTGTPMAATIRALPPLDYLNICSFQGHCYCRRRPIALFDDYCGSRPPLLRIKATGC